jgi:hypothetical protein
MFWSLKFEGQALTNTTTPVYLAAALNAILRVRPTTSEKGKLSRGAAGWEHDVQHRALRRREVLVQGLNGDAHLA